MLLMNSQNILCLYVLITFVFTRFCRWFMSYLCTTKRTSIIGLRCVLYPFQYLVVISSFCSLLISQRLHTQASKGFIISQCTSPHLECLIFQFLGFIIPMMVVMDRDGGSLVSCEIYSLVQCQVGLSTLTDLLIGYIKKFQILTLFCSRGLSR